MIIANGIGASVVNLNDFEILNVYAKDVRKEEKVHVFHKDFSNPVTINYKLENHCLTHIDITRPISQDIWVAKSRYASTNAILDGAEYTSSSGIYYFALPQFCYVLLKAGETEWNGSIDMKFDSIAGTYSIGEKAGVKFTASWSGSSFALCVGCCNVDYVSSSTATLSRTITFTEFGDLPITDILSEDDESWTISSTVNVLININSLVNNQNGFNGLLANSEWRKKWAVDQLNLSSKTRWNFYSRSWTSSSIYNPQIPKDGILTSQYVFEFGFGPGPLNNSWVDHPDGWKDFVDGYRKMYLDSGLPYEKFYVKDGRLYLKYYVTPGIAS